MADPVVRNNNKNGLTVIVGIFAVIAGAYSMIEPLGQRVDFLDGQVQSLRRDGSAVLERERGSQREAARMVERFKEVETQFSGLRDLMDVRLGQLEHSRNTNLRWREEHDARVREFDAAQWERIKAIERVLYGKPVPTSVGEAMGGGP